MPEIGSHIIVPWDYTGVAEYALIHAIRIARNVENEITLLNIIHPDEGKRNIDQGDEKLEKAAQELSRKHDFPLNFHVLEGSIFNAISQYANETEASMVVMGTHGIRGMQKLTGSWALKVIVGSTVPFIVVQDKPMNQDRITDIVFPVDFRMENKEKLQWAIFMGKYFNSKIHLFKTPVVDKSLLRKTNTNLNFAIRFLIQNNIDYEIHTARKSSKFAKETIEFAQKIRADMILITTTKDINFTSYILGAREQYIIANSSRIPVMCVNPRASDVRMGQFMYGSSGW